jgi:hypothetical protein
MNPNWRNLTILTLVALAVLLLSSGNNRAATEATQARTEVSSASPATHRIGNAVKRLGLRMHHASKAQAGVYPN